MTTPVNIPSMISGVSRQPSDQRLASQVEEADNVTLKLTRGCERRNGTRPIWSAASDRAVNIAPSADNYWIRFLRDETRMYLICINPTASSGDTVRAVNLATGDLVTVTYDTTYGDPKTYLRTGTGKLRHTVSGDTTIVSNGNVTPALSGSSTSYTFGGKSVDDSTCTHFKATYLDFDNPPTVNGEYWYAQKDSVGWPAGYYVSQNVGTAGPKYKRIRTPEANYTMDPLTMPVKIFFNGSSFVVSCIQWGSRLSGDSVTNPSPDFTGQAINAITFHGDRLYFGYANRIWGSPMGDYWNTWLDNWQVVGDTDFVSGLLPSEGVSFVSDLASFENGLVVFGTNDQQFLVTTTDGSPIAPGTFGIIPSTRESHSSLARPLYLGKALYWVSSLNTKLMEYRYTGNGLVNMAINCSSHVNGYLPATPIMLSASSTYGMIFLSSSDAPSTLHVHTLLLMGEQKVQSAWSKFAFNGDVAVHCCMGDSLYLLLKRLGKYYLEYASLADTTTDSLLPVHARIDGAYALYGTYDPVANETAWALEFTDEAVDTVVLTEEFTGRGGISVSVENNGGTEVVATGDYSSGLVYVGRSFDSRVRLSPPVVKDQNGAAKVGITTIVTMSLNIMESGYLDIVKTPYRREPFTYTYTTLETGVSMFGVISLLSGVETITTAVGMKSNANNTIDITSSSHLPFRVTSGAFNVRFTPSRRPI